MAIQKTGKFRGKWICIILKDGFDTSSVTSNDEVEIMSLHYMEAPNERSPCLFTYNTKFYIKTHLEEYSLRFHYKIMIGDLVGWCHWENVVLQEIKI